LLLTESDPYRFLQHENYKPLQAAKLLVQHWDLRLKVFGPDRAFLPLNLTGNGAMSHDDVHVFKQGFVALLPDDAQARPVLFLHSSKTNELGKEGARIRCYFYVMHTLMTERQGQPVVMLRYGDGKLQKDRLQQFKVFTQSFPVQLESLYGLFIPPPGAKRMFQDTMLPLYKQYIGDDAQKVANNAVCETPQEMLQELISMGFEKEALPECLGGTWSCDNFTRWIDARSGNNILPTPTRPTTVLKIPVRPDPADFDIIWDAEIFFETPQERRERKRSETPPTRGIAGKG
jgi:hypothetical protein